MIELGELLVELLFELPLPLKREGGGGGDEDALGQASQRQLTDQVPADRARTSSLRFKIHLCPRSQILLSGTKHSEGGDTGAGVMAEATHAPA